MKVEDFNFDLPESLIAQTPLINRSTSKLLVLNKTTGKIKDTTFNHIKDYIEAGDTIVLNNTKVLPARLFGVKEGTGAKVEMLLLQPKEDLYEVLIKPAKRIKIGTVISFGNGRLKAVCTRIFDDGIRHVKLYYDGILEEVLDSLGQMPLPPYIKETLNDNERYQTVYAKHSGSSAAPTAGLHFTKELLAELENKGVNIAYITLHVGLGTFRPVSVEKVEDHKMHAEYYMMDGKTAALLNQTKASNKKIISVGTTSTRTLETIMRDHHTFKEASGFTNIFITPGFEFKAVDTLITNFHLPKSTLMMLVSAFSSKEIIMNAYNHAIKEKYRFFSFGDSMIITEGDYNGN